MMINNNDSRAGGTSSFVNNFNWFVNDDGGGNDGFSRLEDNDGGGDVGGLVWCLGTDAFLGWLDSETRTGGIVALVVNTEESIVSLGEMRGDFKID